MNGLRLQAQVRFGPAGLLQWLSRVTSSSRNRDFMGVAGGALAGWFAWGNSGQEWSLVWLLLLPLAWSISVSRRARFVAMLLYFLVGARGLPGGAEVFFGDQVPVGSGWALWMGTSVLLAMPFGALGRCHGAAAGTRFLLALSISIFPPLAVIGWLNPLTAAGVLFPGTQWAGLAAMSGVCWSLAATRPLCAAPLLVVALCLNLNAGAAHAEALHGWRGLDTAFSRLASGGHDDPGQLLGSAQRTEWVSDVASRVPSRSVLVLPETLLGRFDAVSQAALAVTEQDLVQRGSRVLVGAELPVDGGQFQNAMVVLGAGPAEDRAAVQGIPVPLAMWKPWSADSAVARLWTRGNVIDVAGQRAAVAICYEQLLTFSLLRLATANPSVIVAPSNVWWARTTTIPEIQQQTVASWARLFSVPVISAKNT